MKRILITGGAGGVATGLRPLLRPHYLVRLSDQRPVADLVAGEEEAPASLGDLAALRRAVAGCDGVVHLGGYAYEAEWETILASNIVGVHNVFEAARLEGVRRIVFASSNHAMGFYPKAETIPVDVSVRPDSRYGLSKAFGEALGSLYADKYGAEVLSIRIGHVVAKPFDRRRLAIWISRRDLAQLIRIGLDHPDVKNDIVYGMSDNRRAWWTNERAEALGYRPVDRSEDYAAESLANDHSDMTGDPRADLNQGGEFCIVEKLAAVRTS
ncbi:MAG: NAD(P)-dependent oxidoreductase [Bauldia sp.]